MAMLYAMFALILVIEFPKQRDCSMQVFFHRSVGKYLANRLLETKQALSEVDCGAFCAISELCASVNYKTSGMNQGLCELNSRQENREDGEKTQNTEFTLLELIRYELKSYQESVNSSSPVTLELPAKTNSITNKGRNKNASQEPLSSCKTLLERNLSLTSGIYELRNVKTSENYKVYCHMSEISKCGGGGWTLVMKIDGHMSDFGYSSTYWTNNKTFAVENGLAGLTETPTKLASYWNTPFEKICLGMKVNNVSNWIVLSHNASSLHNVIAAGNFTETKVGREEWKSLITGSRLQPNCNKEGFNIHGNDLHEKSYASVRLGLVANNQNNCDSCNSYIGFGASYKRVVHSTESGTTCCNVNLIHLGGAKYRQTVQAAIGFILVK